MSISRITNFAGGTAKDLDALCVVFEEAAAIVESDLPGTLVYEIYGDENTSRFVARGDHVDSAAFQKHAERLMEAGVLARMGSWSISTSTSLLGRSTTMSVIYSIASDSRPMHPSPRRGPKSIWFAGGVTFSFRQLWTPPLDLASAVAKPQKRFTERTAKQPQIN